MMESGGLAGATTSRVTMQVTINMVKIKDAEETVGTELAQRITLSILKKTSLEAEPAQGWTHWLTKSSYAEEDLPSNIFNFYFEVMGDSEEDILAPCADFEKEQSLWIYHRYKFVENRDFTPILRYPGAKAPAQFDTSNLKSLY